MEGVAIDYRFNSTVAIPSAGIGTRVPTGIIRLANSCRRPQKNACFQMESTAQETHTDRAIVVEKWRGIRRSVRVSKIRYSIRQYDNSKKNATCHFASVTDAIVDRSIVFVQKPAMNFQRITQLYFFLRRHIVHLLAFTIATKIGKGEHTLQEPA